MKKAIHICEIAFDAFFEDTKHLVAAGVRADIAHRKSTASSREELSEVLSRSALRESSLASWLKVSFPLAYGRQGGDEIYRLLLQAISSEDDAVQHGLPNSDEFRTTRYDFVTSLLNMSTHVRPSPPKAPILRNGSFLPVLKVAHKSLLELTNDLEKERQMDFIVEALTTSLKRFKIQFFPAQKPKTRTAGAPNTKPMFNSWGKISVKDKHTHRPSKKASIPTVDPATVAFNNAIATDCNADWLANNVNLMNLKSVLCKMTLPTDFTIPTLTNDPYVNDTYRWVEENYNGTKPLHHLALLVAIIVASSILPNLFMPPNLKNLFMDADSKDDVRRIFADIDWISKSKKGMADRAIFISMFTTFIIAIYEEDSPLRKHMDSAQRRGLGDVWTSKHC